jgi:hypothetical protein
MAQVKWRMKGYHNTHSSLAYVEHVPTGVAR